MFNFKDLNFYVINLRFNSFMFLAILIKVWASVSLSYKILQSAVTKPSLFVRGDARVTEKEKVWEPLLYSTIVMLHCYCLHNKCCALLCWCRSLWLLPYWVQRLHVDPPRSCCVDFIWKFFWIPIFMLLTFY
jgi:hypothetical protein